MLNCTKRHFVPNRYIYLNQSNIETTQDIYLLQGEFWYCKAYFAFVPNSSNHVERYYLFQIDISIWYKVTFFLQCSVFGITIFDNPLSNALHTLSNMSFLGQGWVTVFGAICP